MIEIIKDEYIRMETPNLSFILYIKGEVPEIAYYGKTLSKKAKLEDYLGTTNVTGVDLRHYIFSQYGDEDYRDPSIQIENQNGNMISNFVYVGYDFSMPSKTSLPQSYEKEETICLKFYDHVNDMELRVYYSLFFARNVIATHMELINHGKKSCYIHRLASFQFESEEKKATLYTFDGGWATERIRHTSELTCGLFINDSKTGSSSAFHSPYFLYQGQKGYYGLQLLYSSNHRSSLEIDAYQRARVMIGMNDFMMHYEVKSGETFVTPEALFLYAKNEEDLEEYHSFILEHIMPKAYHASLRPILMNNWEGTYFAFTQEKILKMAQVAKELGVELFVLDDGWFGHRDNDASSLGDWFDYEKKTGGLPALAQKIHDMGLRFGIWVEPEMISEDSLLYQTHPEYTMKIPGRKPHLHRNQMMLDLVNPEVKEYVLKSLRNVLEMTKADYVKWDYNRNFTEVFSTFAPYGEYFHRYILSLYEILDTITKEYPHVLFEGCAAGGSRFDLGILSYMPQIWTSDNTDPTTRIFIQTGTSYVYPQVAMGAHVSASPNEFTKRTSSLATRFHVACGGNLGYELDPTRFSEEEKEIVKAQIAFYKENRKLLQYGKNSYLKGVYDHGVGGFITWEEKEKRGFLVLTSSQKENIPSLTIPFLEENKEYLLSGVDFAYQQTMKGNVFKEGKDAFACVLDTKEYDLYSVMLEIKEI